MGLRINSNVASLNVQRNLKRSSRKANNELAKLSSGKRIVKAADDAAGLVIATKLEAQVRGLRQAEQNANSGISLVQVAETGLTEVSNILIRLRELSVQAASDTGGDNERELLDLEAQQMLKEINRIAGSTTYNGMHLLKGDSGNGTLDFQVGANSDINNRIQFDADATDAQTDSLNVSGLSVGTKEDARDAMTGLDIAMEKVQGLRANLGSIQSRLQTTVNNLDVQAINMEAARSTIEDVDVAKSTSALTAANIVQAAGISTLAQANSSPSSALKLL